MRATRYSKILAKPLRTEANAIATVPLNVVKISGQTANLMEVRDTDDTTVLTKISSTGVLSCPAGTSAGNVATIDGAQTLTSKTLTTPKIAVINDTGAVNRAVFNATAKTIADGAPTGLFEVALANNSWCGGSLFYLVEVGDGTDFQALTGMVTFSGVSKVAAITSAITEAAANQAKSVSAGTLTLAWTVAAGTAKITIQVQPTGSLTETTYRITYSVFPIKGAVTIL